MSVSFSPETTYELDMSHEDDRVTYELEEALIQDYYENPGSRGLVRCPGPGRGRLMSEEERNAVRKLNSFSDHCMDQDSVGEWVQDLSPIKEIADAIWGLEDSLEKHEMWLCAGEEMDQFTKECDAKEALIAVQARSALVGGEYLVPRYITADDFQTVHGYRDTTFYDVGGQEIRKTWEDIVEEQVAKINPFIGMVLLPENRPLFHPQGVMSTTDQMDAGDRIIVLATITRIGANYHSGFCDKGNIYINLKYSSHIPPVGDTVKMIVRLKDVTKAKSWMCVRVLK
jgi:hypothetical protein